MAKTIHWFVSGGIANNPQSFNEDYETSWDIKSVPVDLIGTSICSLPLDETLKSGEKIYNAYVVQYDDGTWAGEIHYDAATGKYSTSEESYILVTFLIQEYDEENNSIDETARSVNVKVVLTDADNPVYKAGSGYIQISFTASKYGYVYTVTNAQFTPAATGYKPSGTSNNAGALTDVNGANVITNGVFV